MSAYNSRTLYTEMEMFIPVEYTVDAINDFLTYQDQVRDQLPPGAESLLYTQVYIFCVLINRSIPSLFYNCSSIPSFTTQFSERKMLFQG